MVKCRVCLDKEGKSKDFQNMHFHLLKKHGMVCRDYKAKYPGSPVTSSKFRKKQKKLMIARRKRIPDFQDRLNAWRHEERESHYPDVENPTFDDYESLREREQWCCQMLGSGIKGEQYKRIYHDLMDVRRALEVLFEQLMRES